MNIKERYKPYNFSSTKCHVIRLPFREVKNVGLIGIEEKLPANIGVLKGIYATINTPLGLLSPGALVLNFNESILKPFQMILHDLERSSSSHPFPVDEEIFSNSVMQGFYIVYAFGAGPGGINGSLTIYLHYEPRK